MASRGPAAIVDHFTHNYAVNARPIDLELAIADAAVEIGWFASRDEAMEGTARWVSRTRGGLLAELASNHSRARPTRFAFNSVSDHLLQGSSWLEECDSDEVKLAKKRRSQSALYQDYLVGVSPGDFEAVCRGIIAELGCDKAVLTSYSKDHGIDFYGTLRLEGKLANLHALGAVDRRLLLWVVGQAKHFTASRVSTPDLRELVGSVHLARTRTYVGNSAGLADLNFSPLDPVLYLFITTGSISRDGWSLLDKSGMVGMDGLMVSAFLSDNGVGMTEEIFDDSEFRKWILKNRVLFD